MKRLTKTEGLKGERQSNKTSVFIAVLKELHRSMFVITVCYVNGVNPGDKPAARETNISPGS